jgi:hypothetical protein
LEGGPPIFRQDGSCPALLEDRRPGFPYGAVTRCGAPFQTLPVPKTTATGLFRVRSPLLTESRLMSVPPATEMFQFAGFASRPYEFRSRYPCGWVAPFGDPGITDRSHLPRAFRSVPRPSSPLSAKASTRCPCFALDQKHRRCRRRHTTAAHRAKPHWAKPRASPPQQRRAAVSMKTLLSDKPWRKLRLRHPRADAMPNGAKLGLTPGPVRLGHITTLSSPFNQPRRGRPWRCRSIFSERRARAGGKPAAPVGRQKQCFAGGGGERVRTDDLLLAKQALSQLSYTPRARDQKTAIRHQDC